MKKKILHALFVVCILISGAATTLGILIWGPSEARGNEKLSPPPRFTEKDGSFNEYFFRDCAQWTGDHFAGRQGLISLNNYLTANLFGTSPVDSVLVGKGGWLYYSSTLDDYTAAVTMSQRELQSAAINLSLMEEYCRSQGRDFAFVIAPNKNSLYGENMPDYKAAPEQRNSARLLSLLREKNVSAVDLFEAFREQEQVLYFAHDSHWNSQGAALGADQINRALGKKTAYFESSFLEDVPHQGDLYTMLYPAAQDSERNPVCGQALDFQYEGANKRPDSIKLHTVSDQSGSLLCYRDSFGNLLYPYLADSYGKCYFSRSNIYDMTPDSDHVVIELVERNLSGLIARMPVMPAPKREIALPQVSGEAEVEVRRADTPESCVLVQGVLPGEPDADSQVYIAAEGAVYEAFCLSQNRYGAYLPASSQIQAIGWKQNNALHSYQANLIEK